jgi:hypothetical protein
MSGAHKHYSEEELKGAWDSWLECKGAGMTKRAAAEFLLEDFCRKTGRELLLPSMLGVINKAEKKFGANGREEIPAEIACAGYAVFLPQMNGNGPKWEFFETPKAAQDFVDDLVRANRGYFPEGLKIFGEIIAETTVQVRFKARTLNGIDPIRQTSSPERPGLI